LQRAEGHKSGEIAKLRLIGDKTLERRRANPLDKLGLCDRGATPLRADPSSHGQSVPVGSGGGQFVVAGPRGELGARGKYEHRNGRLGRQTDRHRPVEDRVELAVAL
jgi:hypothetical protein